jgi:hypothetical protein
MEYYAISKCAQEEVFTQNLLMEFAKVQKTTIMIIFLTKNQQDSQRTKHRHKTPFIKKLGGRQIIGSQICEVRE